MELASVLIGVLPVLLVTALVLCYVCVLRRLCCDTVPRRESSTRAGGSPGPPGGSSTGGTGCPATSASAVSRTSVWCWWADGAPPEELQLTNTTAAFDSQAPSAT